MGANRFKFGLAIVLSTICIAMNAMAAEGGATKADAEGMVKKGIAAIKAEGEEKIYKEIIEKNARWIKQDLYLTVYNMEGVVQAHGANPKMVSKNLMDLTDIDGKKFVRERIELAKGQNSFWQKYKFTNPETKKIEPKLMYCERLKETVVCGGIYE